MRAAAVFTGAASIETLFLTHLHSDHTTDLNDIVTMRWAMSPIPNPLRIVGPVGTQGFVDRTVAMLSTDIGYRLAHHEDLQWEPEIIVTEVPADGDTVVFEDDELTITAAPTDHAPVHPTLGFRVDAGGASVVIGGDGVPCDGLDRLCKDATVYVQTVIRPSLVQAIPSPRLQDIIDYHSSNAQAGATAARAGVGTLVLTHPVPAPQPGTEQEWIDEAAVEFGGAIHLADDLFTLTI
jgi:ribonuclease Z